MALHSETDSNNPIFLGAWSVNAYDAKDYILANQLIEKAIQKYESMNTLDTLHQNAFNAAKGFRERISKKVNKRQKELDAVRNAFQAERNRRAGRISPPALLLSTGGKRVRSMKCRTHGKHRAHRTRRTHRKHSKRT